MTRSLQRPSEQWTHGACTRDDRPAAQSENLGSGVSARAETDRRIGRDPCGPALPLGNANMCGLRIAGFELRRRRAGWHSLRECGRAQGGARMSIRWSRPSRADAVSRVTGFRGALAAAREGIRSGRSRQPPDLYFGAAPAPSPVSWTAADGQAWRAASAICSRSVLGAPSRAWADMPWRIAV
jgi:hypothetical protein